MRLRPLWLVSAALVAVWFSTAAQTGNVANVRRLNLFLADGTNCTIFTGSGAPEGAVVGKPCDRYYRKDGPPWQYVKDTGTGTDNSGWIDMIAAGGAPIGAQYWTGAADGTLSAEKNLGALSTGLVINTSGVPSAYGGASCTNQFPRSLSASGAATCASVANTDITSLAWSKLTSTPTTFGGYGISDSFANFLTAASATAHGNTAAIQTFSGSASTNDCAKFDASGNIVSAGAACGTGVGSGDFSSNTSSSVDSEVVIFSGTGGKTGKRATATGWAKLASGVLSAVASIVEGDFGFTDITTANASTSAHGLLPRLDNNAAHFLDGQGNWSAASGGSAGADYTGAGNPQGSQTGTGGQTYRDTTNNVLYIKNSAASTNTGWYRVIPSAGPMMSALTFQAFYFGANSGGFQGFGPSTFGGGAFLNETGATFSSVREADGWYRYGTVTTTTVAQGYYAGDFAGGTNYWDHDFDVVIHIKTDPSSIASTRYLFGLCESNPTGDDPGVKYIGFRYSTNASDTTWVGVTRSASASVTGSVGAIAANTVYALRMRKISGTVYFSVNDGAETSTSTEVPTGTAQPFFTLYESSFSGTHGFKFQSMAGIRGLIPN